MATDKRGRRRESPMLNKWILATAPARIDLSGGWSDTPLICYEYGSTVTGMAVTIDDKKPLACRC
jgi:fucokinase